MDGALGLLLKTYTVTFTFVLILIVVDGALGHISEYPDYIVGEGLNPYCSGWCSRTTQKDILGHAVYLS